MSRVEHVVAAQNELGEGPVWNSREKALYWVDIEDTCYYRFDPESRALQRVDVGTRIGALAFREAGGFVLAVEKGFAFWDPVARQLRMIDSPEGHKPLSRFNDGAVDRRGRFWAGTLGDTFNNALYRLDPGGRVSCMQTGVDISNGIGWSPDNRTMYFTDSTPAIIYAYDFDFDTGAITNRRVLVDSSDRPGVPDGLTVDQEGFIWSARWDGACIERYDQTGRLERTITVPAQFPTSVAFGGDDLRDLYITSARVELNAEKRQVPSMDGDLFRVRLDVGGLPEPYFAG